MTTDTIAATEPVTVPVLAGRLGVSLYALTSLSAKRPELAAKIRRVSGRRLVMPEDFAAFEKALAESRGAR